MSAFFTSTARKSLTAAAAALAMGAALAASATPAAAGGGWHHKYGWGVAAGVAGGLALGALASQPRYYGGPRYYAEPVYGGDCYVVRRRVLTDYGWRTVRRTVCD